MSQVARREDLVLDYEKYQSNGEEKTAWKNIGEIITFKNDDGTYTKIVKLWTIPGKVIRVFERKENREPVKPVQPTQPVGPEIDIENIPF